MRLSSLSFVGLNWDGNLEVVVDFQRWEGTGAVVSQINGQEILEIPQRKEHLLSSNY
jgi:hypothetical protein